MGTRTIHTWLDPINIHYHDFEDIELADPSRIEQLNASMASLGRIFNRYATQRSKRRSRKKSIRRRKDLYKMFDSVYPGDSSRPFITQRNLDQSPFLALPFELRQQIYELYYDPVDSIKLQDLTYDGTFLLTDYRPCSIDWPPGRGPIRNIFNSLLGLPLTCCIVYPESMVHLYKRISLRFTDPQLAISLPRMMPNKLFHVVRSLDLSFFAHQFFKLERRAKSEALVASSPRQHRLEAWNSLWTSLASSPGLEKVSFKMYQQQNDSIQCHYAADSSKFLTVPTSLSQATLSPLLCFDRENSPHVAADLCWWPENALVHSLDAAGIVVMVNGRVIERICERLAHR